jgi:hypothetical protein
MLKKIKTLLVSISALSFIAAPALLAAPAYAAPDINSGLCSGANLDVNSQCDPTADTEASTKVNTIITTVINIISIVVGVVAVVMIIIGGLRYITSGGDSTAVTGAKNTILYAIVGLIVVALAQFIVRFVLTKATAATP